MAKDGSICQQQLDNGSVQWCTYHCKKLIKYYKTYKSLEASINCLNDDKSLDSYSKDQLLDMNSKLIKVYHYRVVLRDQGYPEYQDQGHQQRIKLILEMIKKLSEQIIILNSESIEQMGETITTQQKKVVATSTKQQKQKKQKKQNAALSKFDQKTDDEVSFIHNLCDHLTGKYLIFLLDGVRKHFIELINDREKGINLMYTALACAFGISTMIIKSQQITKTPRGTRAIQFASDIKVKFKSGCSVKCSHSLFIDELNDAIKRGENYSNEEFRLKYTSFMYTLFIVIYSYRIDINKILLDIDNNIFSINSIEYDDENHPSSLRRKALTIINNKIKQCNPKVVRDINRVHLKIINDTMRRSNYKYPMLDISFCAKLSLINCVNEWKLYHIENNKCIFKSVFDQSALVDLKDIKEQQDFYHFCSIKKSNILNYLTNTYGRNFEENINNISLALLVSTTFGILLDD